MEYIKNLFADSEHTSIYVRIAIIFVVSMIPILELRGGLVLAAFFAIPWYISVPVCIIGNILPMPFVLLFVRRIFSFLKKNQRMKNWLDKLEQKTLKKGQKFERGVQIGLMLFVGIPLPGTGGWTGSLLADLLNLNIKKSFPIVVVGICMAAAIMLVLTYFVPSLFGIGEGMF